MERPNLPPADQIPALSKQEKKHLTKALLDYARELHAPRVSSWSSADTLLAAVAKQLGPTDLPRDSGKALTEGPIQRRLRALLWLRGAASYNDPKLNPVELVERLREHEAAKKPPENGPRD
jgi:hypothetical protein